MPVLCDGKRGDADLVAARCGCRPHLIDAAEDTIPNTRRGQEIAYLVSTTGAQKRASGLPLRAEGQQ